MDMQKMESELRIDEGVRYDRYKDTRGFDTTAIGYNLDANPLPAGMTFPLSDANVDFLFALSVGRIGAALDSEMPWWRSLDEVRQRVIFNMAFNMGVDKLETFHRTMIAAKSGDYTTCAADMRESLWFTQVGQRAVRLANAMESGTMPDD